MNDYPLVSVVIISYNQEEYIVECLESIFSQTYERIELIVSDDSSSDDTFQIIERWETIHKQRFERVIIHRNEINLGISGNLSVALRKATGEYLKILGADDLLLPNAVTCFIEYALRYNYQWIVSGYSIRSEIACIDSEFRLNTYLSWVYKQNNPIQLIQILLANFIHGPCVFISRSLIESINYFQNGFKRLEDYPAWIELLKQGHTVRYIDKVLIQYRIHYNSVSHSSDEYSKIPYYTTHYTLNNQIIAPSLPNWTYLLRWHVLLRKYHLELLIKTNPKYSKIRSFFKYVYLLDPIFIMQKLDSDKQHFNRYLVSKYACRLERESKEGIVQ